MAATVNRRPYFDFMRILAIFFVIWNHTGKTGFALFTIQEPGSLRYWVYVMASVFCTFAVPLFFMISGALILPKTSVRDVWKRRIPKMALILMGFSLAYHILAAAQGDITKYATLNNGLGQLLNDLPAGSSIAESEDLLNLPSGGLFFTVLWSGAWNFSFWFLYAYLAFLISAPLLRTLAEHMRNRHFLYLFLIYFAYKTLVPILNWTVFGGKYTINPDFQLNWLSADIFIYPLAGYFLEHRFDIRKVKHERWFLPAAWLTVLLLLALAGALTWRKSLLTGQWNEGACQTFHRIFNLVIAGTIYVTVKAMFCEPDGTVKAPWGKWSRMLLTSAGACTFGIYLLHVAVLKSDYWTLTFPVKADDLGLPLPVVGLIQVLFTLFVCWAVTALWKGGVSLVQSRKAQKE